MRLIAVEGFTHSTYSELADSDVSRVFCVSDSLHCVCSCQRMKLMTTTLLAWQWQCHWPLETAFTLLKLCRENSGLFSGHGVAFYMQSVMNKPEFIIAGLFVSVSRMSQGQHCR